MNNEQSRFFNTTGRKDSRLFPSAFEAFGAKVWADEVAAFCHRIQGIADAGDTFAIFADHSLQIDHAPITQAP